MTQRPEPASYVVEGRGEFPLEMLRRAGCWPAGMADGLAISATAESGAPRRRVTLFTMERFVDEGRWESHGWSIVTPPAPYSPAVERLKAGLAAGIEGHPPSKGGMVTVPVMLDLKSIPIGQVQDVAFLTRVENALMREFADDVNPGAGVIAIAVARGAHEMTTTETP